MKHFKIKLLLVALLLAPFTLHAQLLYEVTGKGLEKPSYILGTHHCFDYTFTDSIPGYNDAFESVEQVYGEVDMELMKSPQMMMMFQKMMMMPTDTLLKDLVSAEDYAFLDTQIKKYLGESASIDALSVLKPSAISVQLSMIVSSKIIGKPMGFVAIDAQVQNEARKKGLKVGGLETSEYQANLLLGESVEDQAKDLVRTLKVGDLYEDAKALSELYRAQDSQELYNCIENNIQSSAKDQAEQDELLEKLLFERNRNWMAQLPEIFDSGSTMVAVGTGHLHGTQGVITLLKEKGYKVKAVK